MILQKKQSYNASYTKLENKKNKENLDIAYKELVNYFYDKIKNDIDF